MIDSMVLDPSAARSAPAPGMAGGARARNRTEATAGSFEDVLRELDRSEPPRSQEQPAEGRIEGEPRPAREEGTPPKEAEGSGSPEADRAAEQDAAASTEPEAAPPAAEAPAATPERQAVAAGVAGTATAAGEVALPEMVALAPGPAPADPGADAVRSALQAGLGGEPVTAMPVQVPEVGVTLATAAAEVAAAQPAITEQAVAEPVGVGPAATDPGAPPLVAQVATTESGPQFQGSAAGATTADEGAVEALLQTLVGKSGRQVGSAASDGKARQAAREGQAPVDGTSGTAAGEGRPAVRDGGHAAPAISGVEGQVVGTASSKETVPLSRLFQEAGLTAPEEGATPSSPAEGTAASPRTPSAPRSVAPDGMTQAPPPDGPALAEPALSSTTPQGGAVSVGQVDSPAPTHQAAEANPTRQGAALASTPMAQVGDVVVKRLQQLRSPGSDELRLELEPRELGSLKIRLELQGDGVKAQFVVDRPVVQAMLERAMAELRQNLLQQGYRVDELQVALQDDGQARRHAGEQGRQAGPHHGRDLRGVEAVVPETEAPRWVSWAGPGRIDVRV